MDKFDGLRTQNELPLSRGEATDRHVGARLRMRRTFLGMDAQQFERATGISEVDLAAYETGGKRLTANLLFRLSHELDIPVSWFFDGMSDDLDRYARDPAPSAAEVADVAREQQEKKLLDHYFDAIRDPEKQRYLVNLARLFANEGNDRATKVSNDE